MREDTRVFIENFPLDEVEVRTYTEIMPMLQKFEEEYEGNFVRFLKFCTYQKLSLFKWFNTFLLLFSSRAYTRQDAEIINDGFMGHIIS